jgi:hypothetical protein
METVTDFRQSRPLPEVFNRKAKAKQHWPNPQDSVGDLIDHIGRQKCWTATGPARATFLDASKAIREFLDQHTETTSCWVTWSIYMIGDTKDTAVPTITFCSENKSYRKAIRDKVKKHGVLDKYPPGIALKHLPRAPDYKQLVQLASGPYDRHDTHVESAPDHVYSTSQWPSLGDRLWTGPSLESLRKATAGGTIKVDGVDLLMTLLTLLIESSNRQLTIQGWKRCTFLTVKTISIAQARKASIPFRLNTKQKQMRNWEAAMHQARTQRA